MIELHGLSVYAVIATVYAGFQELVKVGWMIGRAHNVREFTRLKRGKLNAFLASLKAKSIFLLRRSFMKALFIFMFFFCIMLHSSNLYLGIVSHY